MASKRKLQAERTKQLLTEKGLELLNQKGYDAVTIDEITEACGVSKGTFYHYFTSKAQFFGTLQYAPFIELDEGLGEGEGEASESLEAYLVEWLTTLSNYGPHYLASWLGHIDNPEQIGEYGEAGGVKADFVETRRAAIKKRLDDEVAAGRLSQDCPTEDIAFMVASAQWGGTVNICLYDGSFDARGWAERQAALISRLIGTYRTDGGGPKG